MTVATLLRASVTAQVSPQAGGDNLCPNPGPSALDLYTLGTNPSTILELAVEDDLPSPNPTGTPEAGLITWLGSGDPEAVYFPVGTLPPETLCTVSVWAYVPSELATPVAMTANGTPSDAGPSLEEFDVWVRLWVTFTTPAAVGSVQQAKVGLAPEPSAGTDPVGAQVYFAGVLVQLGDTLNDYIPSAPVADAQASQVQILVDGSDTPITANGLAGYHPTPGDRLLVAQVGSQVEVLQFLSRGTVPYLGDEDFTYLEESIGTVADNLTSTAVIVQETQDELTAFTAEAHNEFDTFQRNYGALDGAGQIGVDQDYFWVGDDPTLATLKQVAISTYVQARIYAGNADTFAALFNLWTANDIGDIQYTGAASPPMSTFYDVFENADLEALPWNE